MLFIEKLPAVLVILHATTLFCEEKIRMVKLHASHVPQTAH